jgi:hypothetical protein
MGAPEDVGAVPGGSVGRLIWSVRHSVPKRVSVLLLACRVVPGFVMVTGGIWLV